MTLEAPRWLKWLMLAVLVAGGWGLVRTAAAEFCRNRAAALPPDKREAWLERALRSRPDEAQTWRLLAEVNPSPQAALRQAQRAVALDPGNWQGQLRLAELYLQLDQPAVAVNVLRQAAGHNHSVAARTALASMAFLAGDSELAAASLRAAIAIAPPSAVGGTIAQQIRLGLPLPPLVEAIPGNRPEALAAAIEALLQARQLALAWSSWQRFHCPADSQICRTAILYLVGQLCRAAWQGQDPLWSRAAAVWNDAVARGVIAGTPVAPGQVQNGSFAPQQTNTGFAWYSVFGPLRLTLSERGPAAFYTLDGSEPMPQPLLRQWMLVEPSQAYRCSFAHRLEFGSGAGLQLQVLSGAGAAPMAVAPAEASESWEESTLDFTAPPGAHAVELQFQDQRPRGEGALRGQLLLTGVACHALP